MAKNPYRMTRGFLEYPFTGHKAGGSARTFGVTIDDPLPPTSDFGNERAYLRWICVMACIRSGPAPRQGR